MDCPRNPNNLDNSKLKILDKFVEAKKITQEEKDKFLALYQELVSLRIDIKYDFIQDFILNALSISNRTSLTFKQMEKTISDAKIDIQYQEIMKKFHTITFEETLEQILELIKLFITSPQQLGNCLTYSNNIKYEFHRKFSWAVPSRKSLIEIKQFVGSDKILSVCSGRGLWERLLELYGLQVLATDVGDSGCYYRDAEFRQTWKSPQIIEASDAVIKHPDCNVLFLSWGPPEFDDSFISNFKGDKIIFIGEVDAGCTYDPHNLTKYGFILKEVQTMVSWNGVNDLLLFFVRQSRFSSQIALRHHSIDPDFDESEALTEFQTEFQKLQEEHILFKEQFGKFYSEGAYSLDLEKFQESPDKRFFLNKKKMRLYANNQYKQSKLEDQFTE